MRVRLMGSNLLHALNRHAKEQIWELHTPEVFILKAFMGAVVEDLLQTLDNAVNGHPRLRPWVKYSD